MQVNAHCPECSQTPVDMIELIDGEIWICRDCGYQEISAGVDIEAQLEMLADIDPALETGWRETLGL